MTQDRGKCPLSLLTSFCVISGLILEKMIYMSGINETLCHIQGFRNNQLSVEQGSTEMPSNTRLTSISNHQIFGISGGNIQEVLLMHSLPAADLCILYNAKITINDT